MEMLTICYEFDFGLTIRRKNGRIFKNHRITGLGFDFTLALWDVYHTLKKRKSEIIAINSVRPLRVAFALKGDKDFLKTNLAEHPPAIPEDLNAALKQLPGKNVVEPEEPPNSEYSFGDYFIVRRVYHD